MDGGGGGWMNGWMVSEWVDGWMDVGWKMGKLIDR